MEVRWNYDPLSGFGDLLGTEAFEGENGYVLGDPTIYEIARGGILMVRTAITRQGV